MCGYQDIGVAIYSVYVIFILDILLISLAYDSIYSTYVLVSTLVLLLHFVKLVVQLYYGRFDYWSSTCVLSTIVTPPYANVVMSQFPNKWLTSKMSQL